MKRRDQRGFTPSPLISTMYGHFANISLHRQYHKPPPIDSVYPPPEPSPPGPPCPCNVFTILDAAYTALSIEERKPWHDAVKKPGITSYTLWMKEQMTAAMREGRLVTCPSMSGGFSCRALKLAEDPPTWENTIGLAPYEPPEPPVDPWLDGECSRDNYLVRTDLMTQSFSCLQVCGTPGITGNITWTHALTSRLWVPADQLSLCTDFIKAYSNLLCLSIPGRWRAEFHAHHYCNHTDPYTICHSYATYTRTAFGSQDVPIGLFVKEPLLSSCQALCPETDWPDTITLEEWIH